MDHTERAKVKEYQTNSVFHFTYVSAGMVPNER